MGVLELDDAAHHLLRKLPGAVQRASALLLHADKALGLKAIEPLVARLAADAILPAQIGHVWAIHGLHGKFYSLVHLFGLLPRHRRFSKKPSEPASPECYPCIEPFVLPMY